jgi:hypothetical protein
VSGLIATIGLWGADKAVALSGYTPHQHIPSPIEPHFAAPARVSSLTFGPVALAAAVARAATTRDDAPVAVLDALQRSTLPMLETMIEGGKTFGLSTHFQYLADTERTFLAARVGAGITDLYMNALGVYVAGQCRLFVVDARSPRRFHLRGRQRKRPWRRSC